MNFVVFFWSCCSGFPLRKGGTERKFWSVISEFTSIVL